MLNTAAKSFVNAVGASSGPLYATAFMRGAAAAKGKTVLDDADVVAVFQAMAKGIQDRGKAEIGEKTMVDAWLPAAEAAGLSTPPEGTKDMMAGKGRAARLGERSVGHIDPGAASAVIVIEAIRRSLGG